MASSSTSVVLGLEATSVLDRAYRRLVRNNFFADGFGDIHKLDDLLVLKRACPDLARRPLRFLDMKKTKTSDGIDHWEGRMVSPVDEVAPGLLPPECRTVGLRFLLPTRPPEGKRRAVVHLPATGDHTFWRREHFMASPLSRHGIASVMPENPLYGSRRPMNQLRSNLRSVTDLFLMGVALQFESVALLYWLEENGYETLSINGLSMGGHMASMVAATWPKPLGLVSCLGPFTASGVFTRGVLSRCCAWGALARDAARIADPNADVRQVVKDVMDRATALQLFGSPVTTRASIIFAAKHDAYVPLDDMEAYAKHWPGVDVRWMDSGHLTAFLFKNGAFLKGVMDSLTKLEEYNREVEQEKALAQRQTLTTTSNASFA